MKKRLILTLLAAVLGLATLGAPHARAAFVLTLSQVGANVELDGSGSFNTTSLTAQAAGAATTGIGASFDLLLPGFGTGSNTIYSGGITGPHSFGSGGRFTADSATGTKAGVLQADTLVIAGGYVSGSQISETATFNNTTISALGVTPGTYVYKWGSGASADTLTFYAGVPAPAPEPSTWALLAVGLAAAGLAARRRRARLL